MTTPPKLATGREINRDTSPEAEEVLFRLLREAPVWRKWELMEDLNRTARELLLAGLRRRYPAAGPGEIDRRLADLVLGEELAAEVYGVGPVSERAQQGARMIDRRVLAVTQQVTAVLEALGADHVIGGSLAGIAHGRVRTTMDADIVADLRPEHAAALIVALHNDFYIPDEQALRTAIEQRRSFNLIHLDTMFKIDIFLPGERAFDRQQISRRMAEPDYDQHNLVRRTHMRKLWVKAWITLDGVFDADTMDYWWQNTNSPERMSYITEQYSQGDAYLLGRKTYEMLWPGWSQQTTGDGPGPILNRMHKYVVSTTLTDAPWKESTIIGKNVVEVIAELKQQPGKDIIIDGSATLVHSLMGTDLIDEYRFIVEPFIMGTGRRFFPDGTLPSKLELVDSKALGSGSLALVYRPAKPI